MNTEYTAVVKQDGDWWIGWVEEVPRRELPGENLRRAYRELEGRPAGSFWLSASRRSNKFRYHARFSNSRIFPFNPLLRRAVDLLRALAVGVNRRTDDDMDGAGLL